MHTTAPEQDHEALSDPELMALAAGGHLDAFATIVRRHQQALLNFFYHLGVYTDAEDLVQDTFVRLFKYRAKYKPKAKLTTFLYMMGRQIWIDRLRREKRRREFIGAAVENEPDPVAGTRPPNPRACAAAEALQRLPERMRTVVVLNIYQGLKYKEIAEVLHVPEGTIKSRMFHALRKLKETMDAGQETG